MSALLWGLAACCGGCFRLEDVLACLRGSKHKAPLTLSSKYRKRLSGVLPVYHFDVGAGCQG